jgi:hypothetical protein
MAKIDVSKIEGYTNMTAEEKIAALEAYETADPDYTGYIKKSRFDEVASELAAKKRELREKMSAEEQQKLEEQQKQEELQSKYEALLKKTEISECKAKLLGMGYEENLAATTAEAMVNGDTEAVFAAQRKHLESVEKRVRAEALKDTPRPVPDGESKTMTLERFRGLSSQERYAFSVSNPEEYAALYNTNSGGNE